MDESRRIDLTFHVSFLPFLLELAHLSKLCCADWREIPGMREKDDPYRRRESFQGERKKEGDAEWDQLASRLSPPSPSETEQGKMVRTRSSAELGELHVSESTVRVE